MARKARNSRASRSYSRKSRSPYSQSPFPVRVKTEDIATAEFLMLTIEESGGKDEQSADDPAIEHMKIDGEVKAELKIVSIDERGLNGGNDVRKLPDLSQPLEVSQLLPSVDVGPAAKRFPTWLENRRHESAVYRKFISVFPCLMPTLIKLESDCLALHGDILRSYCDIQRFYDPLGQFHSGLTSRPNLDLNLREQKIHSFYVKAPEYESRLRSFCGAARERIARCLSEMDGFLFSITFSKSSLSLNIRSFLAYVLQKAWLISPPTYPIEGIMSSAIRHMEIVKKVLDFEPWKDTFIVLGVVAKRIMRIASYDWDEVIRCGARLSMYHIYVPRSLYGSVFPLSLELPSFSDRLGSIFDEIVRPLAGFRPNEDQSPGQ